MKNKLWDLDVEEIPCSECPYSKLTKLTSSFASSTLRQGYICKKKDHQMISVGFPADNSWNHVSVDAYNEKESYCVHLADYFMAGNDIFRKIWNSKIL